MTIVRNINYAVSRVVREPHKRRHIETKNGKLRTRVDWDDNEALIRLRRKIAALHPGWSVVGYCPSNPELLFPKRKKIRSVRHSPQEEREKNPIWRELADMQARLHSLREEMRDNRNEKIDLSFVSALAALGGLIEKMLEVENENEKNG